MTDTTIAALAARLDELETRNAALEARNAALEADVRDLRTGTGRPAPPADGHDGAVGRRALLAKGLAVAGAAAAGAVLLDGAPAAADNGDVMRMGSDNSATQTTFIQGAGLHISGGQTGGGSSLLTVESNTQFGISATAGDGWGVRGDSIFVGVEGVSGAATNEGAGVLGLHANGVGVDGRGAVYGVLGGPMNGSTSTVGVRGTGRTGVQGATTSVTGYGVQATSTAGTAAHASSTKGFGVEAYSTNGTALKARGTIFGVIAQSASSSSTDAGLAASALKGMAILADTDDGQVMEGRSTTGGGIALTAPKYHLRLFNDETRGAPTGDTIAHQRGDVVETTAGELWLCVANGTPGTWRKLAGPATAGAFHVLPAPARVYDSRPGFAPTVGTKTPFAANTTRAFDLKVNASGVPAGATAVMVNLLLVNAAIGNGNATIWANGATKPVANTLVWGGDARRFSALAVTAIDSAARVQVNTSLATDLVIDVVGYYR